RTYVGTTLADAPAAYWRLGESSGTTVADASGQNRTATINGAVKLVTAGGIVIDANTAMTFDGSSTSVRSNAALTVGADMSIEARSEERRVGKEGRTGWVSGNCKVSTLYLNGRLFVGLTDIGRNCSCFAVSSTELDS